jgi:hypothetical protein
MVHVRLPPALKAQLERNAKRAARSVTKEIEIRLENSYLKDEEYGGPQMAAMFREMAKVALGVTRHKNRGSFFDDFETFVFIRDVWYQIVQRQMPRPREEFLAEVCRDWDAFRSGSLQTAVQHAAREWLIRHTPMTLAHVLAGMFQPGVSRSAGPHEPEQDNSAIPQAAGTGETAMRSKPAFSVGTAPPIESFGKALETLIPSQGTASTAFSGGGVRSIGSLAKVMEELLPSQGNARAAAAEVSRLAQLLADATEGSSVSETTVPRIEPDAGVVAVRK